MKRFLISIVMLVAAAFACEDTAATPFPTLESSSFDSESTAYGFFPSPPEVSLESVLGHYRSMGEHADFVLFQHAIPWEDFLRER